VGQRSLQSSAEGPLEEGMAAQATDRFSSRLFGRLSKLLASGERQEQRVALSVIHTCGDRNPATWLPRLCVALEQREGTGDFRRELVGELFLSVRARHLCEKPALVAALHDPDSTVQVLAARVFAMRYPRETVTLVAPLSQLLERLDPDEPKDAANKALELLAAIGSGGAAAKLAVLPHLGARSSGTRLLACWALNAIDARSPAALESLQHLAESERYCDTAHCADDAIKRIDDKMGK